MCVTKEADIVSSFVARRLAAGLSAELVVLQLLMLFTLVLLGELPVHKIPNVRHLRCRSFTSETAPCCHRLLAAGMPAQLLACQLSWWCCSC
jgi:hypothetical protein